MRADFDPNYIMICKGCKGPLPSEIVSVHACIHDAVFILGTCVDPQLVNLHAKGAQHFHLCH